MRTLTIYGAQLHSNMLHVRSLVARLREINKTNAAKVEEYLKAEAERRRKEWDDYNSACDAYSTAKAVHEVHHKTWTFFNTGFFDKLAFLLTLRKPDPEPTFDLIYPANPRVGQKEYWGAGSSYDKYSRGYEFPDGHTEWVRIQDKEGRMFVDACVSIEKNIEELTKLANLFSVGGQVTIPESDVDFIRKMTIYVGTYDDDTDRDY